MTAREGSYDIMVSIITDSTADLGEQLAREHQVHVVPLSVYIGGKTYRDGVDLGAEDVFRLVEETGELPKTSAPTIAEFKEAFESAEESIYIGISSRLSASVANANLAAQLLPDRRIHVVDSLSLSTGIGLLVLMACDLRDQGLPPDEIVARTKAAVPKLHVHFIVDTLRYLYLGGRCTAVENLFGSVLKIRPVLETRADGTLGVADKVRGPRRRGLQWMLDDFAAHADQTDLSRVFVTHAGCPEDADYLAREIRTRFGATVLTTTAGAVISSHCGPGTIGVLYLTV